MRVSRCMAACSVVWAMGALPGAADAVAQVAAPDASAQAGAPNASAQMGAPNAAAPAGTATATTPAVTTITASPVAAMSPVAEVAAGDALTARLKHLETDLRCLVCQNQTLADSDAPLAADLRREVRELAVAGKSDDDIRAYLTARYGDFVLYNPPVKRTTWVLWFGPFVLLAGGVLAWAGILRRRATASADAPGDDDQAAEARGRDRLG